MALISKILEGTLASGATSISFTDADIPNSFIRIGSTDVDLMPVSQSLSGTTLTITYEAQSSSKGIVVNLVKAGISVIDALNSTDANNALSAKQGKVLKDAIDALGTPSLSGLSDVDFTSLSDGDIIVYDGVSEKFVNNSMPSIPSSITDLDDVILTSPTEGQILSINGDGDIINSNPSGGGGVNYSTTEQDTGLTWIDGSHVYQKTIFLDNITFPNNSRIIVSNSDLGLSNIDTVLSIESFYDYNTGSRTLPSYQVASFGTYALGIYYDSSEGLVLSRGNGGDYTTDVYVTLKYTKTS